MAADLAALAGLKRERKRKNQISRGDIKDVESRGEKRVTLNLFIVLILITI